MALLTDPKYVADPTSVLDYSFDWTSWLDDGDELSDSEWSITPAGPTLVTDTFNQTTSTVWITGGTLGKGYRVTNHITTSDGREDDRSFRIIIIDR